jgi:hypothetical protein
MQSVHESSFEHLLYSLKILPFKTFLNLQAAVAIEKPGGSSGTVEDNVEQVPPILFPCELLSIGAIFKLVTFKFPRLLQTQQIPFKSSPTSCHTIISDNSSSLSWSYYDQMIHWLVVVFQFFVVQDWLIPSLVFNTWEKIHRPVSRRIIRAFKYYKVTS